MDYQKNFIEKSKKIYNDFYDYSLVEYNGQYIKVKIICPMHGVFEQMPKNHYKNGCKKCTDDKKRYSTKKFIEESKKIHGDKFDYSKVEYTGSHNKVRIICNLHGIFEQKAYLHLQKQGCPICGGTKKYTYDRLIEKFNKIHIGKYIYEFFEYDNYWQEIKIICADHGEFFQKISTHINGCGCPKCGLNIKTNEQFVKESKEKHGNKYDYSLVNYEKHNKKVKIICPVHGVFEQTPTNHTQGYGCELCSESNGEKEIRVLLENKNINFTQQKTFKNCKDKQVLPFDFYLPDYNLCIEYDGIQHFESKEYFGGDNQFNITKKHDQIKNEYCIENNINLLRIRYDENIENKMNELISSF